MSRRKKTDPIDALIERAIETGIAPEDAVPPNGANGDIAAAQSESDASAGGIRVDTVDPDAAIDALDVARDSTDAPETEGVSDVAEATDTKPRRRRGRPAGASAVAADRPKTKAAALDALARVQSERDVLRAQLDAATAAGNEDAVNRLAGALSASFQMAAAFRALRKGPHWQLPDDEAARLGAAWAPCLAPYMSTLGRALPWMLALGATYGTLKPRLDRDAEIVASRQEIAELQ